MRDVLKDTHELSAADAKSHLVEQVMQLVDRTFAEGGAGAGMRGLQEMLLRLDERSLREMLLGYGVEGAEELREPEPELPRA